MTPDVDDFLKEVSVVFPVRGDVIRTALAAAEKEAAAYSGALDNVREVLGLESTHYLVIHDEVRDALRDADRMSNTLYAEPLLDWVREHYDLYLRADPSECGVDHDVAMKLLIARANLADAAEQRVVELRTQLKSEAHGHSMMTAENARLKRRCEVADRGLVNYEQWCVKLKTLCGGDMSRNNISDTVEVVERKIERLRGLLRRVLQNWRVGHQANEYPALLTEAAAAAKGE